VQNVSLVWLVCGVLNVRFPAALLASTTKDEISETPAGPNYKLGYYLLPVTCFVLLYSILPHKVVIVIVGPPACCNRVTYRSCVLSSPRYHCSQWARPLG
jgi:hypothetical protein